jgi:uncharacterized membrane protein
MGRILSGGGCFLFLSGVSILLLRGAALRASDKCLEKARIACLDISVIVIIHDPALQDFPVDEQLHDESLMVT